VKEKISRLAKGIFDYRNPQIEISEPQISIDVVCGVNRHGAFKVRSLNNVQIRAMVFSSLRWMHCLTPSFMGERASVEYEFDSSAYEPGDTAEGSFTLVTNGGEIEVPFTVNVCNPFCIINGTGRISDLDQFAALAKDNWGEALEIFSSDDFERVFLQSKKNRRIYQTLIKGTDSSLAMEEFLCAAFRKNPVNITVSEELIEFVDLDEVVDGKLVIEKDDWGHVKINVSVRGDFITVFSSVITEDSFLGSFYQLEYRIKPTPGTRTDGAIVLETFGRKIVVPVRSCYSAVRDERNARRRNARHSARSFFRLFCSYELGQVSRDSWLTEAREDISGCLNNSDYSVYKIVEADYLNNAGKKEEAGIILDEFNERELRYRSAIEYIYYLFANAEYKNDEHYTDLVTDTIRFYAEGQLRDRWEPQVLLIRLEHPAGAHAVKAFKNLSLLFENGQNAMPMFLEAVRLVNMEPSILREAGSFETSLFIWGMRRGALTRESIFQYASLTMRMREFRPQYMYSMMKACETYESKEMLSAVLHLLAIGHCTENKYNSWYALGIESALRTPDLYENYMASLDLGKAQELPSAVLIYFQFDNRLPADQRAYLYRYVVEQRERYSSIFSNYNGIIRAFAFEQLRAGNISMDLAVLYGYYLKNEALAPHVLKELPTVMFKKRMKIENDISQIRRVIVNYEEIDHDIYYEPQGSSDIYVDLFLDDYRILFEDADGGRHVESVRYSLDNLLDTGKYIRSCYEECPDEPAVLLNRSERALKYQMMDDTSINVYKRALKLDGVSRFYQKTILKNLIDYYYDSYEGETLEKYLLQIDLKLLDQAERSSIVEYFIQRGLFEKAYAAAGEYGYENIHIKRVMRLCSRIIRARNFGKNDFLVGMAVYAFENGRYDETILNYLNKYYNGPTAELYEIWKAARDFEVQSFELEERFLCEALFADRMLSEACEVFMDYYGGHPDIRVVRAFLAVYSYRYLTDEETAIPGVFKIMEIELDQMDTALDVCSLAMLKYASSDAADSTDFILNVYDKAADFIDRGIIFPFFRNFAGQADVPVPLVDMSYIICRAAPGASVSVRYKADDAPDGMVRTISLFEAIDGLYVRGFRLMPGEGFSYSIIEKTDDGEKVLKEETFNGNKGRHASTSGADDVRWMIDFAKEGNDQALEKELSTYDRFDEMADRLFHLV